MTTVLMHPDTQPELSGNIPDISAPSLASPLFASSLASSPSSSAISPSRYDTVRLWADSLVRVHPAAIRQTAPPARPVARPYTLAQLVADTFGVDASPATLARHAPESRLQRLLVQSLGERLGVTKWAPALAGGGVAALAALVLALVVQVVWSMMLAAFAPELSNPVTAFVERTLTALLGGNPLQLLALANLAPLQLFGATSPEPGIGRLQLTPPLSSLLLIPILALLLGGALSAASDCTRRARYSVARGALVGPVYALLLTLLTLLGGVHLDGASFGLGGAPLLIPLPEMTLFYGLLWGTLFGALGGWVRLYGRGSLDEALRRLARLRFKRLVGSLIGAVVALAYGLGGSLALALVAFVALVLSGHTPGPLATAAQATHLGGTPQGILGLALLLLTLAPSLAIWVFVYASGGALDVDYVTHAPAGSIGINFSTWVLPAGAQAPSALALYLLALLPLACCFVGGRAAARFAGVRSRREGFLTGALVVLPLFALMLILATLATFSLQANLPAGTLMADVAPALPHNALMLLGLAALVAGLGGCDAARRMVTRAASEASEMVYPPERPAALAG